MKNIIIIEVKLILELVFMKYKVNYWSGTTWTKEI